MATRWHSLRVWSTFALIGFVLAGSSGCGYLKNMRDDAMDCFIVGAGIVPPVVYADGESHAVGFLPPCLGAYLEVTEFFHLGALFKATGDIEMDRRAAGAVVDVRTKIGFGPLHYIRIMQQPVWGNAYKSEGNHMDGWREHMYALRDPVFHAPAKELIFDSRRALPFLHRGWQDWEVISLEVAIPEPFFCHKGCAVRVGFDLSQVVDFLMSAVCLDLYDDNAFTFTGALRFPGEGDAD